MTHWEYVWSSAWSFSINHLWQSTLFAALASLVVISLKGAPARVRYWIWTIASLKFILPSALIVSLANLVGLNASSLLLSIAWSSSDPVGLVGKQHKVFHLVGSSNPFFSNLTVLFAAFGLIWFTGVVAFLVVWIQRHRRIARELHNGVCLREGRECELLQQLQRKMRIRRPVQLMCSSAFSGPGVYGVRRPIIVFPDNMTLDLRQSELEAVMLHELAHIARRDNLVSNAQMVVNALLWFHPLVWWIDRQMLAERERACDDRVLESCKASKVYASGLLKVVQFGLQFKTAGISCASGSDLKRRIRHIVSQTSIPHFSVAHKLILTAMVCLLVMVSMAAVDIGDCERDLLQKRIATQSNHPIKHAVKSDTSSCPSQKSDGLS